MTRRWAPILAAAAAAAAAAVAEPAAAQEPLVLPEPEPVALNCGYASLSPADMDAARARSEVAC